MFTIEDNEFNALVKCIKVNYGITLDKKKALIEGRLGNMIFEKGFKNYGDYLNYVFSDKSGLEMSMLVDRLTTNHTYFMREAAHFDYFRDKVLPYLISEIRDRDLRVWSAGCSSGEEPYSLAMIISDFLGHEKASWDTKVLATDISTRALEKAQEGTYQAEDIESVPSAWKRSYFGKPENGRCMISESIKKSVIFRNFNLMNKQFPFRKKFHVIFCRNVMIYFDQQTKNELVNRFYENTEPGGYIFIGLTESINRETTEFEYIMPAVYRKRARSK